MEGTQESAVRSAMFNQGCPMSAGLVHERIYQGSPLPWPSAQGTQVTLDVMERAGRVKRFGSERWGWSYWLQPLEGFGRETQSC